MADVTEPIASAIYDQWIVQSFGKRNSLYRDVKNGRQNPADCTVQLKISGGDNLRRNAKPDTLLLPSL